MGGLKESILEGETGLLADSFEGFVDAIRTLLSSRELRERMGIAAKVRASGFSWEDTASAMAAVLAGEDAAAAARGRPEPAIEPA